MNDKTYSNSVRLIISLSIVFCLALIVSAWTEPASAPPGGNVTAPLNVGSATQTKAGGLNIGGNINTSGKLQEAGYALIPAGAIMFFNLASCPSGWTEVAGAAGRFLVAAGTLGSDTYSVGNTGGEARHTISIAEMPSHSHTMVGGYSGAPLSGYSSTWPVAGIYGGGNYWHQGGSTAHENRPPYITFKICQKN